uniref:PRORP domain-containing protein n=1 Tax=Steinernema glaseri TaxID=37863 RepID=A0A1I7YX99_9BILA
MESMNDVISPHTRTNNALFLVIPSARRKKPTLTRSVPFLGWNTLSGSTSSTGTRTNSLAKASTSPTKSTMLLQRLRSSVFPLFATRVQAHYSTSTPADADQRAKRSQVAPRRRLKSKPAIPEVKGPYNLFQSLSAPSLSLRDAPVLHFLGLKDGQDTGIPKEAWEQTRLPEPLSDSKIIDALRKCNQFVAGRQYIEQILEKRERLAPSAIIEAAKFFPLIAIQSALEPEIDKQLIAKIEEHVTDLPKSIFSDTIRFFVESGKLACSAYVKQLDLEGIRVQGLLFQKECFAILAHESMTRKDGSRFLQIAEMFAQTSHSEICSNKHLHSMFCDLLKFSESKTRESLEKFFFQGYVDKMKCVSLEDHTFVLQPVFKVLEAHDWTAEHAYVNHKGSCDACGSKILLNDELSDDEFDSFKSGIKDFVEGLSRSSRGGSMGEMMYLERLLQNTEGLDPSAPCLVMDSLNVLHSHWQNLQPIHKLILSLLQHYAHIVFITRPGLDPGFLQRLKRLPVSVFFCDRRSEDDIFVLLAASQMGPNCHVMTNDFFLAHRERLDEDVVPLFDRWMARRCVRFHRSKLFYQIPPAYSRTVQHSPRGYHIPVQTRGGQNIPDFSWMCLQKPSPSAQ